MCAYPFQWIFRVLIFALMQKYSTFALLAIVVFFIFCPLVVISDYRMAKWKDVVMKNLKNHNIL